MPSWETKAIDGNRECIFTRDECPEAIYKNKERIRKAWGEPGDGTPLGTEGTVIGSITVPERPDVGTAYFIEWDNRPGMYVLVIEKKLGPTSTQ